LAFANAAATSDRALDPGRARNPAANHLHPNAAVIARITAGVAAVIPTMPAEETEMPEAVAAGNATAFPVPLVHATPHRFGGGLVTVTGLHDGSLLDTWNAAVDLPRHGLGLGNHLVLDTFHLTRLGDAFAAIRGVILLLTLAAVHSSCTLVRFRDPLLTT